MAKDNKLSKLRSEINRSYKSELQINKARSSISLARSKTTLSTRTRSHPPVLH